VPLVACILLFVGASFTAALTNAPRRLSLVDCAGLLKLAQEMGARRATPHTR
jgi:hypothetical protein